MTPHVINASLKKGTSAYHKICRLKLFAEYALRFQSPSMPAVRVK